VDRRGVFEQLKAEALAVFDRIIVLDLDDVAVDGSLYKAPTSDRAPARTPLTGPSWVGSGPPLPEATAYRSGVIDGADRYDVALLEPTLDAVTATGLFPDIGTLHLDRSYDSGAVRTGYEPRHRTVRHRPTRR
jgi:hypothetical protein